MKKTLLFFAAIALFASTFYSSVYAKDIYYVGASAGRSDAKDWCSGSTGRCDDRGKGFKAYVGIQITKNFGAEISYLDLGEVSIGTTLSGVSVGAAVQVDGFSIVGTAALPLTDRFDLFVKAGFFSWNLDAGLTVSGLEVLSINRDGTDETYGIGARVKVSDRIGLRAEWERFKDVGDSITDESDVDLLSVGGVLYF